MDFKERVPRQMTYLVEGVEVTYDRHDTVKALEAEVERLRAEKPTVELGYFESPKRFRYHAGDWHDIYAILCEDGLLFTTCGGKVYGNERTGEHILAWCRKHDIDLTPATVDKPVLWIRPSPDYESGFRRCDRKGACIAPPEGCAWMSKHCWKQSFPDHDIRIWEAPKPPTCDKCGQPLK